MGYRITDGYGWFVKKVRSSDKQKHYWLWSPNARDAADIHFLEVAEKLARDIPMPVKIVLRPDRKRH
jgi:hypothetical protein